MLQCVGDRLARSEVGGSLDFGRAPSDHPWCVDDNPRAEAGPQRSERGDEAHSVSTAG